MTADETHIKQSLYRKYRPQTFDEVVGQGHVARTLRNAVAGGTVAHGYVFAGPRGTGKTSMARIVAKALNCVGTDPHTGQPFTAPTTTPCGTCRSCVEVAAAASLDVIEMDAASNRSIDDIRDLRDKVAFAPVRDRFKVYIIDEAHMLTREAFNALLKTLEEPPPNVVFILATTEAHKLPDTIVSRCQRFDFHRPTTREVIGVLSSVASRESIDIEPDALITIAEHSEGGFRDAIGALDRLAAFAEGRVQSSDVLEVLGVTDRRLLLDLTQLIIDHDTAEALAFVHGLFERGTSYPQFIRDALRHLRQLFLLQQVQHAASDPALLRALGQNVGLEERTIAELQPLANQIEQHELLRLLELLGQAQEQIRAGLDPRLQLELALVKITQPHLDLSLERLDERLRRLEETGGAVAVSRPRPHAQPASAPAPASEAAVPTPPVESSGAAPEDAAAGASDAACAQPASDAPDLARVQRVWPLVADEVQAHSAPLAAMLADTEPRECDGVTLRVAAPSAFARDQLSDLVGREALEAAVERVLGWRLAIEVVLGEPPAPQRAASPVAALSEAEKIALIQRELGAQLLGEDE